MKQHDTVEVEVSTIENNSLLVCLDLVEASHVLLEVCIRRIVYMLEIHCGSRSETSLSRLQKITS